LPFGLAFLINSRLRVSSWPLIKSDFSRVPLVARLRLLWPAFFDSFESVSAHCFRFKLFTA
jgi:hypothetical protein